MTVSNINSSNAVEVNWDLFALDMANPEGLLKPFEMGKSGDERANLKKVSDDDIDLAEQDGATLPESCQDEVVAILAGQPDMWTSAEMSEFAAYSSAYNEIQELMA